MLACWLRGVFDKETNVRGRDYTHSGIIKAGTTSRYCVCYAVPCAWEKSSVQRAMHPPKLINSPTQLFSPTFVLQSSSQEGGEGWFGSGKCRIINARWMFATQTVLSKNKGTTVSRSTSPYYTPMCGVVWCLDRHGKQYQRTALHENEQLAFWSVLTDAVTCTCCIV